MKVGRNITFGFRTPAVIHELYQNIFVDSYCFFFFFLLKNMAELTEMDRSLSRIKKKKKNQFHCPACNISVFQICCKTRSPCLFNRET